MGSGVFQKSPENSSTIQNVLEISETSRESDDPQQQRGPELVSHYCEGYNLKPLGQNASIATKYRTPGYTKIRVSDKSRRGVRTK